MLTKSSLLLVAIATAIPFVSAFTCDWRGGDYSSFTWRVKQAGRCCTGGGCPIGYALDGFIGACDENWYENCFGCGVNSNCCEHPFSTQWERETTTTCCQCAGDEVYDPISDTRVLLSNADCAAEVSRHDGRSAFD